MPTSNAQKFCDSCTSDKPYVRASASFSYEEIRWLLQLMTVLMRGGDARILVRAPVAKKVYSKVEAMRRRINGT